MAYSLEKDGDKHEIRYSEFLKKEFPCYKVFWSKFITPLTERVDGGGIGLRNGIDPLLENIAMAHLSLLPFRSYRRTANKTWSRVFRGCSLSS